jgi:hypothetical protein
LLSPCEQHGEHSDSAADVTRIAGEFDDRSGAGLHQHAIAVVLIGPQHLAQLSGHGDGDVKVRHWQHLRLPAFEPLLGLRGVALGTAAIAAGMVGEHLGVARFAAPHLATERRGAAVENVLDGAPV